MNGLGSDLTALRGDYARAKRTSGNVTLNSATWANVDTGLDLVLAASTGDVVEYAISAVISSGTYVNYLDVVTVVSGNPVNSFGYDAAPANPPTSYGLMAWYTTEATTPLSGSVFRTLVAGDISSSTVTLRLRYAQATAGARTLQATAALPVEVWARNHGPIEI